MFSNFQSTWKQISVLSTHIKGCFICINMLIGLSFFIIISYYTLSTHLQLYRLYDKSKSSHDQPYHSYFKLTAVLYGLLIYSSWLLLYLIFVYIILYYIILSLYKNLIVPLPKNITIKRESLYWHMLPFILVSSFLCSLLICNS